MNKHVIVIGSGIAGLSAGVYAQKCGFDVTVLESHSIAGGNCTSWKRKGYLFEGAMHWLTGSNKNQHVYTVWQHIGALNDDVAIQYSEPVKEFIYKGTSIKLYRNVDKTEKHLIELSPEDAPLIRDLCTNIRKVQKLVMPIWDLRGVKVTKKRKPTLKLLFNVISANRILRKFSKVPKEEYISRFKHDGIREFFYYLTVKKYSATWLFFSMGTYTRGDGGFPQGGSLPFVGRIVTTFKDAGGKILFNTRAERVLVENGKAVGVKVRDEVLPADAVIVASDTMKIDHLFDIQPQAPWLDEMRASTVPTMGTFVSLGINADLKMYPKNCVFKLETPVMVGAVEHRYLSINNYANDPFYSPDGKAVVTMILISDTYDFWKKAKEDDRYEEEKEKIAADVIATLTAQLPEIKDRVEVCDVATPLTYERYCDNWRGSWMTMMERGMKVKAYPAVVSNITGLYFAGHRMRAPGGLPVAAMSGRTAVQYLCRDTKTLFVSEE